MRYYKIAAMALIAGLLITVSPVASAQQRQTTTRVIIIRTFPGPFFYDPFFYGPPAYAPERVGYVKLETQLKEASVYVDGGYAGRAGKLKHFALAPGTHEIALRDSDHRTLFQERVAVILGETTKIRLG